MFYILLYFCITAVGYFIGSSLKKSGNGFGHSTVFSTIFLVLLIFVMGVKLGADDAVVEGFKDIGVIAVVSAIFALCGSVIAVGVFRRLVGFDKRGERNK